MREFEVDEAEKEPWRMLSCRRFGLISRRYEDFALPCKPVRSKKGTDNIARQKKAMC